MKSSIFILLVIMFLLAGCFSNGPEITKNTTGVIDENNISDIEIDKEQKEEIQDDNNDNTNTIKSLEHITIVALGDSLTEGFGVNETDNYPSQLQNKLDEEGYNSTVINQGISGETSAQVLARLDETIEVEPDIVILTIGANDGFQYRDTSEIKTDITNIIKALEEEEITVVLGGMHFLGEINLTELVNFIITEFNVSKDIAQILVAGSTYGEDFRAIYIEIAEEQNVAFIPFFLQDVAGYSRLNIEDGIHPTGEGYAIIIEQNIWPVLEPLLVDA